MLFSYTSKRYLENFLSDPHLSLCNLFLDESLKRNLHNRSLASNGDLIPEGKFSPAAQLEILVPAMHSRVEGTSSTIKVIPPLLLAFCFSLLRLPHTSKDLFHLTIPCHKMLSFPILLQ